MDWSAPDDFVSVGPALEADDFLAGKVAIAENGGAELLYWLGPDRQREKAVKRMRAAATSVDGVLTPTTGPGASCGSARRPATWCSTARPAAGSPRTRSPTRSPATTATPPPGRSRSSSAAATPPYPRGETSSLQAKTVDVAPTVARFFGVGATEGRVRRQRTASPLIG